MQCDAAHCSLGDAAWGSVVTVGRSSLFGLSVVIVCSFVSSCQTQATSGHLHAELVNLDVASQPAPLSVSFMSDDLDSVLSGILVTETESKKPGTLPLGRLIYRVKSGIFTVV